MEAKGFNWDKLKADKSWRDELQRLLSINDKAVRKAILIVSRNDLLNITGQGFDRYDKFFMNGIAYKIKTQAYISKRDFEKARKCIKKYWKQLMIEAKIKARERKEEELKLLSKANEMKQEEAMAKAREEILQNCQDGKPCSYGICDECPVTLGTQLHF